VTSPLRTLVIRYPGRDANHGRRKDFCQEGGKTGFREATGAIAPGLPLQGPPRDDIYLFQIKYSFEKFRNSEAMQEYNSILYSYVALSIKGTRAPNSN